MGGGPAEGRRGSAAFPIPDHFLHRSTPRFRANSGLMQCSKQRSLFDHLVGGHLQGQWYFEAERFRGFEVDDQLELRRLQDR